MGLDENKAIVQRAFDAMTAGPDAWRSEHGNLFAESLVGHFSGMPPVDASTHLEFGLSTFEAFPDLERPVDDMVAEGDKVVARWTSYGTHTGHFQGLPPTGRRASMSGITIFRLEDGKIVEEWSESDMLGLLMALGAIPAPGQAGDDPGTTS
jgi:steroid delta-isomerase-like uncharacterized protein